MGINNLISSKQMFYYKINILYIINIFIAPLRIKKFIYTYSLIFKVFMNINELISFTGYLLTFF